MKCEICGKEVKFLYNHVKEEHKMEGWWYHMQYDKSFIQGKCVVCGKDTPIDIRTGEPDLFCSTKCKKLAPWETEVVTYECAVCGKEVQFPYKHAREVHGLDSPSYYKLSHKGYVTGTCVVCGKVLEDRRFASLCCGGNKCPRNVPWFREQAKVKGLKYFSSSANRKKRSEIYLKANQAPEVKLIRSIAQKKRFERESERLELGKRSSASQVRRRARINKGDLKTYSSERNRIRNSYISKTNTDFNESKFYICDIQGSFKFGVSVDISHRFHGEQTIIRERQGTIEEVAGWEYDCSIAMFEQGNLKVDLATGNGETEQVEDLHLLVAWYETYFEG